MSVFKMPQNYTFLKIIAPVFLLIPAAELKLNYLRGVIETL